uniref:Phage protein n=2 Tax=Nonomuraea gerenzanensis TaxID=93944 RepID=A0A1M4DVH4_9ACTN|nr:Phage protein [Nonomuraea gerenzanensis]
MFKRAYDRAGSPEPKAHAAELVPWTASCYNAVQWFKKRNQWSQTPKKGSLVFFGPNGSTHVELVIEVHDTYLKTIGGNTGGTYGGKYHDGDGVYIKTLPRNSTRIYGYGHPKYASEVNPVTGPIYDAPSYPGKLLRLGSKSRFLTKWQRQMKARGWSIQVDGIFGPETLGVVKRLQEKAGLAVDGVIGPKTWAAAWA